MSEARTPLYPYATTCYTCARPTRVILVHVDPEKPNTLRYLSRCEREDCKAVYSDFTVPADWIMQDVSRDERTVVEESQPKPKRRARAF